MEWTKKFQTGPVIVYGLWLQMKLNFNKLYAPWMPSLYLLFWAKKKNLASTCGCVNPI